MTQSSRSTESELPTSLERLVRQLAALPLEQRQRVVAAAEREAARATTHESATERAERWKRLRALAGVVDLGGNALDDCERLYDG